MDERLIQNAGAVFKQEYFKRFFAYYDFDAVLPACKLGVCAERQTAFDASWHCVRGGRLLFDWDVLVLS
jgi:hypothetical protein